MQDKKTRIPIILVSITMLIVIGLVLSDYIDTNIGISIALGLYLIVQGLKIIRNNKKVANICFIVSAFLILFGIILSVI